MRFIYGTGRDDSSGKVRKFIFWEVYSAMGADSYFYYVNYEEDKNSALQKLRQREFEAGRYSPAMYQWDIPYPVDNLEDAPTPGKQHPSIEEVWKDELVMEQGTGTILDIMQLSDKLDYSSAYILKEEELIKHFGTDKPTREIIDKKIWDYWEYVANSFGVRGVGICITVYKNDVPAELYFAGFSYD